MNNEALNSEFRYRANAIADYLTYAMKSRTILLREESALEKRVVGQFDFLSY